jgi:argininosuccinate synthase
MHPLSHRKRLPRAENRTTVSPWRLDIVESRFVGMKSRGVYETPGGTVLCHARRGMESICLDRGEMHMKAGAYTRPLFGST